MRFITNTVIITGKNDRNSLIVNDFSAFTKTRAGLAASNPATRNAAGPEVPLANAPSGWEVPLANAKPASNPPIPVLSPEARRYPASALSVGRRKRSEPVPVIGGVMKLRRPSSARAVWFAALLTTALACAHPATAQERPRAVPSVGSMQDIPDAGEKPDPKMTYKIVFDVQTLAESSNNVSPGLQAMGGLINTYRGYGVPASRLQMTAVFHGPTILLVTRDEVYQQRTGTAVNPNAVLLRELAAAGVQLVVCGQSALGQHYAPADYLPAVQTNLSATVTFLNLQTRGYIKISE